jgi:hypothetical protein
MTIFVLILSDRPILAWLPSTLAIASIYRQAPAGRSVAARGFDGAGDQ